jgi:arylsulfatase
MMIVPPGAFSNKYDRAGEISNAVISVKDLPMTILEYAGVAHPKTEYKGRKIKTPSGISAKPFLDKTSEIVRNEDQWYAFELFGNGYLMQGDFKIIKVRPGMFGDGEWHLYNVVADPSEMQPLETEIPEKFESMKKLYASYAAENNIMEVDSEWNPFKAASE